jgi:acyl transferase domain-containing protein/NADPH:quinone reductase-like Zn-dependent oxidoreductase
MSKRSAQTPKVPASRFNVDAYAHENNDRPGSFRPYGGYFLDETLQEFDPSFFGITPVEAMWMDPQQRKLLEVVYEAFESAGATLDRLAGSDTACFVATFTSDFQQMCFKEPSFRHNLAATGVDPGIISNRISHVFSLRGPSVVVNTACSSSVYAIHNACNALRNRECSAAVVGGSNLILTVDQHMNTAKLGVLSPTSTCHTFNSYADGYGRAEGVGAVYIKLLRDAIRDGDPIRGVIRSSATNNNGRVPGAAITHPNLEGQRDVIEHAYRRGGLLDPRMTGYFECHGTGTAVGDPLEVRAVLHSMNRNRQETDGPLHIGAVKTNIGHSEASSGLSALIKAILTVERGVIPPTHGVTSLNPAIKWQNWKVNVPTEPTPFPSRLPLRRVSVNSFGYGGTNAHIIVEGAESLLALPQTYKFAALSKVKTANDAWDQNRLFLLPFSAHDTATLKRNVEACAVVANDYDLLDLSYTLTNRRTQFSGSKGFVVASPGTLGNAFQSLYVGDNKTCSSLGLCFVFTGQGAQWAGMGAELMAYYPSFARSIRQLDMVLSEIDDAPDWTIADLLRKRDPTISRINEAEISQPLCTALQIALVNLLHTWGIESPVTVGHSSGEIAAAYAAGFISASQAIILAYYRGKAAQEIRTDGAMLAVGLGVHEVGPYLENAEERVVIACHNSPSSVTLSGDAAVLERIREALIANGVFARLLKTDGKAYHSHHIAPAAAKYENWVRSAKDRVDLKNNHRFPAGWAKMVSSVTNTVLSDDDGSVALDEAYWSRNLLSPVLFDEAIRTICTNPEFVNIRLLVEIGPHSALAGPIRQIKVANDLHKLEYLPTLVRGGDCAASLLKLAGELFLRRYPFNLPRATSVEELNPKTGKVWPRAGKLIVDLPPYQWDKTKKFWAESRTSRESRNLKFPRHDLLGSLVPGGSLAEPTWRNVLRIRDLPWLRDHRLGGEAVFPAAGYFSMAMEAITQLNELQPSPDKIECYVLRDILIQQALVTSEDLDDGVEVMLNMHQSPSLPGGTSSTSARTNPWWDFSISSVSPDGSKKKHMSGRIGIKTRQHPPAAMEIPHLPQRSSGKAWNHALKTVGFDYGPTFQDMDDIRFDGKTYAAHCSTVLKTTVPGMIGESRHVLHPAAVDSCLQLMIVAIWAGRTNAMAFGAVPVATDEVVIWKPTDAQLRDGRAKAFSWVDLRGARLFTAHNELVASGDGRVVMQIKGMRCSAYEAAIPQGYAAEVVKAQPYSNVVWKVDVDYPHVRVAGGEIQLDMDTAEFVELAVFKHPGTRVLAAGVDPQQVEELLNKLPGLDLIVMDDVSEQGVSSQGIKNDLHHVALASIRTPAELGRLRGVLAVGSKVVLDFSSPQPLTEISELLMTNGFSEVDFVLKPNTPGATTMVATTVQLDEKPSEEAGHLEEVGSKSGHILLVSHQRTSLTIASEIKRHFKERGFQVTVSSIQDGLLHPVANVVILDGLEGNSILANATEHEFLSVQKILSGANNIVWASCSSLLRGLVKPESAMALGLLRSLRSERASLNAVTIDLDTIDGTLTEDDIARFICDIATEQITKASPSIETEYCVSADGLVFISRVLPNERLNDIYAPSQEQPESIQFEPDLRLVGKMRSGKVMFEVDNTGPTPTCDLQPEYVEVRVMATGLNGADVRITSGADFRNTLSHEIGGIVTQVGSLAGQSFQVGDRVVGFSLETFSTYQKVHHSLLQKLESGESLQELASLPLGYATALYALETLAAVEPGETVLILPGTGFAGQAAMHVALALKARPYVGVAEEAVVNKAMDLFGIQDRNRIVVWPDEQSRLQNRNGQYEVDVVFSTVSVDESLASDVWRHIAPFGRFVQVGSHNTMSANVALDGIPIRRGASYHAFDPLELHRRKPAVLARLLARTMSLYREGSIPVPKLSFKNISLLNKSVSTFSETLGADKVVILHEPCTDGGTLHVLPSRPQLTLRRDGTYLLVGCLGGLGRSLTSWMLRRGARSFAFLSRSGADAREASSLVQDLRDAGAEVYVIRGDVGVRKDVERAIQSVPPDRPIRGVINAAMVLRVSY